MAQEPERLTLSVDQTCSMLGIGRSLCYEAIRSGQIPAIRLGGKWLVSRAGVERMVTEREPIQQ